MPVTTMMSDRPRVTMFEVTVNGQWRTYELRHEPNYFGELPLSNTSNNYCTRVGEFRDIDHVREFFALYLRATIHEELEI